MRKCPDCHQNLKGWEVYCPKCSKELSQHGQFKNNTNNNDIKKWNLFNF